MHKFSLSFKLKGERDYVHGTDIIDSFLCELSLKGFGEITDIRGAFHKKVTKELDVSMVIGSHPEGKTKDAAVLFTFSKNNQNYQVIFTENDQPVSGRYIYDEKLITNLAKLDTSTKKIILSTESPFTLIEKIVALNKKLLTTIFQEETGKWYFGKIELSENLKNFKGSKIAICLVRNIGVKFTKSEIRVDNKPIGFIYFTMQSN